MNTALSASIGPRFRTIDGLNIRYADTGGAHESTLLLTSPTEYASIILDPITANGATKSGPE